MPTEPPIPYAPSSNAFDNDVLTQDGSVEEEEAPESLDAGNDFLNDAIGLHQSTDALLAFELNQLSLKERDAINEEVHGVGCKYLAEETPEFLEDSLQRLNAELKAIKHKPAFVKSQSYRVTWVNTDNFRMLFLRCELFDARKAAKRIVAFLELVLKYCGDFALQRSIRLSDFGEKEIKHLRAGYVQLLSGRDRSGRRVFGHYSGDVIDDLFDPNEPNELHIKSRIMTSLYIGLKAVQNDPESQRSGVVLLFWMHQIRTNDLRVRSYCHKLLVPAVPFRISSVHCYVPSSRNQRLIEMGKNMFLLSIGSELRSRLRIHVGSYTECLYIIQTFGIEASQIPINPSTGERKTATFHQWLEQQSLQEELQAKDENFSGIDCPRHSDVLFGRGWPIRKHPGNALYRHVLEQYLHEYNMATDRGRKSLVAWSVVCKLKDSHGSRFLREDKNGGFWYEVSDDAAREKVSVGFRDMRKPKNSQDNKNRDSKRAGSVTDSATKLSKRRCGEGSSPMPVPGREATPNIHKNASFAFIEGHESREQWCSNGLTFCSGDNSVNSTLEGMAAFKWF